MTSSVAPREVDTIIVGGSAAGLATAACLRRAGQSFEILEQASQGGAVWRGHYDRLHLHTPRGLSGLPHFGFPRHFPRYPARDQVVEYLASYAAHFGLTPRFGQRVTAIERAGNRAGEPTDEERAWLTRTQHETWQSRHVVIATGNSHTPHRPEWPGQNSFGGPIMHSAAYRNGGAWAGRKVLVVGIGNSGAEIALDLLEHGARPSIAIRSPVNIIPRDLFGLPIVAWSMVLARLPAVLADAIAWITGRIRFGRLERLGLSKLPYGPATQARLHHRIPIIDVGTIDRVRRGEIAIVSTIASFSPGQVHLQDGSTHAFDAVVLATGYRTGLRALLGPATDGIVDADGTPQKSGTEVLPGLFLCGYQVATTGMLREIAKEARRIARTISGRGGGRATRK